MSAAATASVSEALRDAVARLTAAGVPEPRADAEVLLAHALGTSRAGVIAAGPRALAGDAAARLDDGLRRRETREPVAYITGEREFWSLPLAVDARVLVPRPETELLVEVACRVAPNARRVLDCGTGSGAIAAALARELPAARVWASDRSADALVVARGNLTRFAPAVGLVRGDLLAPFAGGAFDLVVANPPYVAEGALLELAPEVRDHEPRVALTAGPDGLDALRALLAAAPDVLRPGGWLCLELGAGQAPALERSAATAGRYRRVFVTPDHAGIPRVLAAERGERDAWMRS